MDFKTAFVLLPYILSAIISLLVGMLSWKRKDKPGAQLFAWVAFSETVWTIGYIFQLTQSGINEKLFWNNVQFLGAVVSPLAYLGFSIEYARPTGFGLKRLSWKLFIPLAAAILAFIWTDEWHGLFRGPTRIETGNPFDRLVFPDGIGFGVYTIYAYGLITLTTLILISRYLNAPALYRKQINLVLIGILMPWLTSIFSALGWIPLPLHEITPITFGFCNLLIAWALFRYHLLKVIPVARDVVFDFLQDGVLILDSSLRIVDINEAARKYLRIEEKYLGEKIGGFLSLEPAWFDELQIGHTTRQELNLPIGDTLRCFEVMLTALRFPDVSLPNYLVSIRDIQEQKNIEEQLEQLAVTDTLTGVDNRRNLFTLGQHEIGRALSTGHPLCMIMIDVDHFKRINDNFGHLTGDKVLAGLAAHCQSHLRGVDIFGRYGGEEFMVILPDTELDTAAQVAERLRKAVEEMRVADCPAEVRITISLGVASLGQSRSRLLEGVIVKADEALLEAKQAGRNIVYIAK